MEQHHHHNSNEKKTFWVVILTALTMVIEIVYGISTHSMALLADGIHMASHVLAIGLSWLAYVFIRKHNHSKYSFNEHKLLSLTGFSSGLMLLIFAFFIIWEAIHRIITPVEIEFREAIIVACLGLIVNIASAFLLHHEHDHGDHNIRAAYLHVIADAITSVGAIIGLLCAMLWNLSYIDTIAAIISSAVIIKWSVGLLAESGKNLIDMNKHE